MALASPGLFWRTFLLILLLLAASSLAWLQSFRGFEREPRAHQLAEQVIDGLLARPQSSGQLGRLRALRAGKEEDVQVRRVQVPEAALVEPLEHPAADGFPRNPKQRPDERRQGGPPEDQETLTSAASWQSGSG